MTNNDLKILQNLTILYAEDDLIIQESIVRILKMFFGTVIVAKDGMEAIEFYEKYNIHVVLLDYVMPIMSGYDVANKIRETNTTIPIVIASAYTDKEKLINSIPLKLTQYLEKPILYDDLMNIFSLMVTQLNENNSLLIKLNDTLTYNHINKTVERNGAICAIQLTKNEVEFLELLLKKPNQLVTKNLIEDVVYGESVDENTLRNMIYRLRKKLEIDDKIIVTIKDLGYMINI